MTSQYPPPPPHYLEFDSIDKITSIAPPPPPKDGICHVFGDKLDVRGEATPALEALGRPKLYDDGPGVDYRVEVKKLNQMLVASYRSLLGHLGEQSSAGLAGGAASSAASSFVSSAGAGGAGGAGGEGTTTQERVAHIEDIFVNIHYILNQQRPHLALLAIKERLESQVESRELATAAIRAATAKAKQVLAEAAKEKANEEEEEEEQGGGAGGGGGPEAMDVVDDEHGAGESGGLARQQGGLLAARLDALVAASRGAAGGT